MYGMLGKHHTESSRKKMHENARWLGKRLPESLRKKISNALKGNKNPSFGKKRSEETRKKMSAARKGYKPSQETLKKMSESQKGKKPTELTRKKMSLSRIGDKNPSFGKKRSEETRKKMSAARKGEKNPNYGKPISKQLLEKISGENCHLWKGDISFLPYCFKFNNRRKKRVRLFFGNLCICCGKHSDENISRTMKWRKLSIHHIDHDKEQGCNGKLFNLVPLCDVCHAKELYNEKEYKGYINKTLGEGFKWGIWSREQYEVDVMYSE